MSTYKIGPVASRPAGAARLSGPDLAIAGFSWDELYKQWPETQ